MTRALAVASVFLGAGLQQPELEPDRIVEAARAVMAAARYCAWITLDGRRRTAGTSHGLELAR